MTIEEMQKKREALQIALTELVKQFQNQTGVSVTGVRGHTADDYIGRSILVMVEVEVSL